MAQALFDQHPLEAYLAESLDDAFVVNMPGALEDYPQTPTSDHADLPTESDIDELEPQLWIILARYLVELLSTFLVRSPSPHQVASREFAERCKYIVISSSLLDTSLSPSSSIPDISRFPSPVTSYPPTAQNPSSSALVPNQSEQGSSLSASISTILPPLPFLPPSISSPRNTAIIYFAIAALVNGYSTIAVLILCTLRRMDSKARKNEELDFYRRNEVFVSTIDSLETLVLAGNVWSSVVNEAMGILESEERRLFYGPSMPLSPSSSLRASLQSTLQTTQSQTDNVRQLFAPLTSTYQLSRLSEMYAPPTPIKPSFSTGHGNSYSLSHHPGLDRDSHIFPKTIATSGKRASMSAAEKRTTWSGPEGLNRRQSLNGPGSSSLVRRRSAKVKVKSGLGASSTVFPSQQNEDIAESPEWAEAPSTPGSADVVPSISFTQFTPSRHLRDGKRRKSASFGSSSINTNAPLLPAVSLRPSVTAPSTPAPKSDGQRLTHSRSHNSLILPPSSLPLTSSLSNTTTPSPSSRYTLLQTTRHPLSLSSLQHSLQGAIGSKRFAAAHLLALRFIGSSSPDSKDEDEEDESYWEDVRSVISLLTTTLEDAAARLIDALEETAREKKMDGEVSPLHGLSPSSSLRRRGLGMIPSSPLDFGSVNSSPSTPPPTLRTTKRNRMSMLTPMSSSSYAPARTPSEKFVGRVEVVNEALEEAKVYMKLCLDAVRVGGEMDGYYSRNVSEANEEGAIGGVDAAMRAYERLRRELGVALRECERGRSDLEDIARDRKGPGGLNDEEDEDGLPALAHDHSSNDEDGDSGEGSLNTLDGMLPVHAAIFHDEGSSLGVDEDDDETRRHLLMTSSVGHLPPAHAGIEQVFEVVRSAEEVADEFGRRKGRGEKGKLSREERIRLMKEKREQDTRKQVEDEMSGVKKENAWGPSGDVVQELKDVLVKVGERRRKLVAAESSKGRQGSQERKATIPDEDARGTSPGAMSDVGAVDGHGDVDKEVDMVRERRKSLARLSCMIIDGPFIRPPSGATITSLEEDTEPLTVMSDPETVEFGLAL